MNVSNQLLVLYLAKEPNKRLCNINNTTSCIIPELLFYYFCRLRCFACANLAFVGQLMLLPSFLVMSHLFSGSSPSLLHCVKLPSLASLL